ncbi:MAG TPA: phosphoribosylanthranilate isomerase [Clostridia bacterium]|nr:phosphoribosylanthranilate isomerase [Clostridia bacterium]
MAKIKICGIMRQQDIDSVNIALPDFIGFVFAKSKRQIGETKAKALKACLNPSIKAVGVFVNEDIRNIVRLCSLNVIDIIQLHGDENEVYIKSLKNYLPNKIIKAIRVKDNEDIKKATEFSCDYLLFDAYHEEKCGGIGKTFDWSLISEINRPYFLAGGINISNIAQAIKQHNPYCIDISSGAETNGFKDPEKIVRIVAMTREIQGI